MKKIAIIGGGPAGLAAAKAAMEEGLAFDVFESSPTIGGVWRPNGLAWPSMRVNISRYTGVFSDFPWEQAFPDKNIDDYPTSQEMFSYLCAYVKHFNLEPYIRTNTPVTYVGRSDRSWVIRWYENDKELKNTYDYVILATGRYQNFKIPQFKNIQVYKGEIIHSAQYNSKNNFVNKKVLIIGGSVSGVSIAEELADVSLQTFHLIRRPRWILPRRIAIDEQNLHRRLPLDLLQTRQSYKPRDYEWYLRHCKDQNEIAAWEMNPEVPSALVISDTYLNKVRCGDIDVIKDDISYFTESGVVLMNEQMLDVDSVICCTGYQHDWSYLDQKIYAVFNTSPSLYEDTFHPEIPYLAFIGLNYQFRGAVFPLVELQTRLACAIFKERISLPSVDKMKNQMASVSRDGITFATALAGKLDILNFSELKNSSSQFHRLVMESAIIPAQYRLLGAGNKFNLAKSIILNTESYRRSFMTSTTVSYRSKDEEDRESNQDEIVNNLLAI